MNETIKPINWEDSGEDRLYVAAAAEVVRLQGIIQTLYDLFPEDYSIVAEAEGFEWMMEMASILREEATK